MFILALYVTYDKGVRDDFSNICSQKKIIQQIFVFQYKIMHDFTGCRVPMYTSYEKKLGIPGI